ncbi:MAG: hypothetical protein KY468_17260 [Armatimonadetes bacterium]|nr:hypothetical protein [Armatimonadota bacterium]
MPNLHSEVIKHMLEVVDAKEFSVLLHQPQQWKLFFDWCRRSPDATYVMNRAAEKIDTVCLDRDTNLYCVAMSMTTLECIVKELVEAYEDLELARFIS